MSAEPVVDAEVMDEPGTELEPVTSTALFKADSPAEVVEKATEVDTSDEHLYRWRMEIYAGA